MEEGVKSQSGENKEARIQKIWLSRLSKEQKAHKNFRDRAKDVAEIYNGFDEPDQELYVPLYWQVVNVEHSGVYSNQPVPDVRPRNNVNDPTLRAVSEIIERGLVYTVDQPNFDDNMHRAVDDYLAMALGVIRVKVDSVINETYSTIPIMGQGPMGPVQIGTRPQKNTTIGDQYIRWEFVPWDCFGWQPGNNWKATEWVYFKHRMTQAQIKQRFGRAVAASKADRERNNDSDSWRAHTVDIYEIWCKKKREVIFLAKGEKEPLEIRPDPLELKDFFPCPTPMMMNLPSDELIPKPDYDYIESYDAEINRLQERRMGLLEQIKASGAYDMGLPELSEMFENEDGEYTAIQNLMQRFAAAGGPDNAIYHLPIQEKVATLQQLTEQIGFVKASVDEVLGISDIVRGVTTASETATAQEIKGRWVGVRLTRKRECVQFTIRSMLRMTAQLLASHITPENLQRMTQMQITEQMMQILQDDILMEFSIDIELDSTVAKDEFKEMQTKQEMLNGVAQYAQSVLPMVQQNAMPAGVASAILRSALGPYARYDRGLEDELTNLQTTMQQLQQLQQQNQQAQQQVQQLTQQTQQQGQYIQMLQQQATEAKAAKEQADAGKKKAETQEILAGLPADQLEGEDASASIALKRAQSIEALARAGDTGNDKGTVQ